VTVYGGYGPRLLGHRGHNQVQNVIALLRERPTTRRAAIQLFDAEDLAGEHKEIPCTTALQFLVREGRLHLIVTMRSNDAYIGLPHDVFCFTMLQEIVARAIDYEMGTYRHFVGSMHLYDRDRANAESLIKEGFQLRIEMPPMPAGNPWPAIDALLAAEAKIRAGDQFDANDLGLDPYWCDLIRLLQIFPSRNEGYIEALANSMSFRRYRLYISARIERTPDAS